MRLSGPRNFACRHKRHVAKIFLEGTKQLSSCSVFSLWKCGTQPFEKTLLMTFMLGKRMRFVHLKKLSEESLSHLVFTCNKNIFLYWPDWKPCWCPARIQLWWPTHADLLVGQEGFAFLVRRGIGVTVVYNTEEKLVEELGMHDVFGCWCNWFMLREKLLLQSSRMANHNQNSYICTQCEEAHLILGQVSEAESFHPIALSGRGPVPRESPVLAL